jgi:hypothetical protein
VLVADGLMQYRPRGVSVGLMLSIGRSIVDTT